MAGFVDQFGGSTLNPADVGYRGVSLTVDLVTQWPPYATIATVLADNMEVLSALPGLSIWLPDARLATPGASVIFYNTSANQVGIKDAAGASVASVEAGGRRLVTLTDNTTEGGVWIVTLLGVGTGTLDAAGAAGAGLVASGATLNVAFPVATVGSSRAITAADRDYVLIWTGGAGVLTLPNAAAVGAFSFEVRNQGTGALVLQPSAGNIDGASNITLNNAESCWVHVDAGQPWYTVGRGRNTQFSFTQLQKAVTGGTVVLTLTEAANVVQTYTGALISNVDVVLPAVVQVYYVSNQTTGAFNFRLKNPGVGTTLSIPSGQNAVVFSDGTNVINASTTIAGIGSISFGAGSAASPSVQVGAVNNGLFAPSSTSLGVSNNGVQTAVFDTSGLLVVLAGNSQVAVRSAAGSASLITDGVAGSRRGVRLQTATADRFYVGLDTVAETGTNAGSNLIVEGFNDAGVSLGTYAAINRAAGQVSVPKLAATEFSIGVNGIKDLSLIGEVRAMVGPDTLTVANHVPMLGQLLVRADYPALWTYAQTTTPVSEAAWAGGQQGRFSVGNGSTTFRVPESRGYFIRALNAAATGIDPSRAWGATQASQNLQHNHGVNDPQHNHGLNDPAHQHAGATDVQGVHQHSYTRTDNGGQFAANAFNWSIYNSQVGAATSADGAHAHNFATDFRFTGITLNSALTGITIQNSGGTEARPHNIAYPHYMRYQ